MTTMVSVNPRVVAAGIEAGTKAGERRVRLTLALLPGAAATGRIGVDLQRWPAAIEQLLAAKADPSGTLLSMTPQPWAIQASRAVAVGQARPLPDPSQAVTVNPTRIARLTDKEGQPGALVDSVTKLWDWTMGEGAGVSGGIWAALADVIAEAGRSGNREKAAQHGVAGIGRAEAALVLTAARGEDALLAASGRRPAQMGSVEAVPAKPFDPMYYMQDNQQAKDDIERKVAQLRRDKILKNDELRQAMAQAEAACKAVAGDRERYVKENELGVAVDILKGFRLCPNQTPDGGCTPAGRSPKQALEQGETLLKLLRGLHRAATAPDDQKAHDAASSGLARTPRSAEDLSKADADAAHQEIAAQLLFAIRANPTLARLFRFVVDIEVDAKTLLDALQIKEGKDLGDDPTFAFVACTLGAEPKAELVWTVTRFDRRNGEIRHVWPALREDMELHLARPAGAADVRRKVVSQSNGLVRLAQAIDADQPGRELLRFDLVTVDPAFAIDANVRIAESAQDRVDSAGRSAPRGSEGDKVDVASARAEAPPLFTRGLCIVDRWRQAAIVSEIVNARTFAAAKTGPIVVDAEDLATGYRVHVGLWSGADIQWRSLMNRSVDYKAVGPLASFDIEVALGQLGLKKGSEQRLISDAASVAIPSRTRSAEDAKTGIWIHVEELLATWEGDPLAVACKSETVEVRPGSDLSISRTYSLDLPAGERSHALRFGRAYQAAVGVVWLGGVSVPRGEVEALAKHDREVRIPCASASSEARSVRRFLRHEPLRTPVLLLPVGFAARADRYVRQTGPVAILRAPRKDDPDQDSRSWRVILPPRLALDEVVRHGVLDKDETAKPRGAFESVNIDAPWQDFPVYGRPKGEAGPGPGLPSGEPLKSLRPGTPPRVLKNGKLVSDERVKRIPPDEPGEPVFMIGGKTDRQHPYWPDPAAEQLVVALRPAKRPAGAGYFEGKPIVVDVLAANDSFRNAVPVVIEFERVDEVRKSPAKGDVTHAMLVPTPPAAAYTDGRRLSDVPFSGGIQVQRVKVRLYRGEHVAADCWFAPRASTLRSWFDLPETIVAAQVASDAAEVAVVASLDRKFDDGRSPALITKRLDVFETLSKKLAQENEAAKKKGEKPKPDPMAQRWIAAAGIEVGARHVAAVADVLGDCLRARPIPQLAGLVTVEAVHAVKEPVRAPAFDRSAKNPAWTREEKVLALTRYEVRVSNNAPDPRRELLESYGKDQRPGRPTSGWSEEPKEGATGLLLAGTIQVDLDSCSQLEVLADVVAPQGSAIDDETRRRPDRYRLVGRWPEDETGRTATALSLFGFSVDPGGRVTLPTSSVTLLRIDDLDAWNKDSLFAGLDTVDLAAQQLEAIKRDETDRGGRREPGPRVTAFDPFKDTLARKLRVSLRTTTRHGELVRRIVPDDKVHLPEDYKTSPALSVAPVNPCEAEALDLWLPATRRPSQPVVHTVMPAFYWTHAAARPAGCVSQVREARVRIWLNRPWFSAGEDERLGIVLWPPRLRGLGNAPDTGKVPRPDVPEQDSMDLMDYTDDLLGPGGKFVTRWGADPIREAPASLGPFMSEHAFKDLPPSDKPGRGPAYVPSVDIPIVSDNKPGGGTTPATVLTAGLITYEPCFDVVSERWYVDVALNPEVVPGLVEPFVRFGLVRYQAHAIKGLNASTPVVAWGQVLPLRDAKIWWEAVPQPGRPGCIQVQVTGRTISRRDEQAERSTRMQITLVESSTSAGLVCERTLDTRDATYGSPNPATHDQGLAWTAAFTVQRADPASQLFVLIQEQEPYLGTQDEPVPSENRTESPPMAQFSGPRFIAKIPLPPWEKAEQAATAQACGAA